MIRFLERVPHYRIYQVFLTWLYVKCSWTIIQYSDWLTMCNIVHSCLNFRYSLLSASQVLKFVASWSSGNIMALTLIQHTIHKLANLISWSLPALCAQFLLQSRLWCMRRQRTIHKDLLITISSQLFIGEILKMKNSSLQKWSAAPLSSLITPWWGSYSGTPADLIKVLQPPVWWGRSLKIIHCATVCFYSYLGLQLKDVNVFVFSQNLAAYLTSYKLSLASWELSKNLSKTRLRNLATLLISVQKLSRHYHPKDAPQI